MEVVVKARHFPTEELEKVSRSLLNIFPEADITVCGQEMVARARDLSRFKELIRNHRILDSTRAVMLRGMANGKITFQLNKQAAFVGKVSFAEGQAPLGPITVEIGADDLETLIDEVAPRTVNGEIP